MKLMTKRTMLMQLTIKPETISIIITEAINKILRAEVDTNLLEEDTANLKTSLTAANRIKATEVHHQLPKTEVHIEEIVATKTKAAQEAKTIANLLVTQAKQLLIL
jgi:hypothetical protein